MNRPESTYTDPPVLVEVVGEFVAFDDQAIDNPATLASLKRLPQETPVLSEVVAEFCEFDDLALRDARELSLLKRPQTPTENQDRT